MTWYYCNLTHGKKVDVKIGNVRFKPERKQRNMTDLSQSAGTIRIMHCTKTTNF